MPRTSIAFLTLLIALVHIAPRPAYAWGHEGHRVTGHIAESLLTPKARHELRAILGWHRLSSTTTWMDDQRDALKARNPATSQWHYENRGICTGGASTSCATGDCPTRKIAEYRAVLASPTVTRAQKRAAVRYLVHMVGDIHQPLHIGDNGDRGGNDVAIVPPGREPITLHAFWDHYLVDVAMLGRGERRFATALRAQFAPELRTWMAGDESSWAAESFDLARDFVYPKLDSNACQAPLRGRTFQSRAGSEYVDGGADIASRRIAMAGARIAHVLNSALDPR
jgi:nuclease S1